MKETEDVRCDQQIAYACMEAELQVAATKSQAIADYAATQAAQAIADARSATTEVPRLDATVSYLQQELQLVKVAAQQAQERALHLETQLSTVQDRIGAADAKEPKLSKAMQHCSNAWTIGMPLIPICMLHHRPP